MGNEVRLNDVGQTFKSGQHYGGSGETGFSSGKTFDSNFESIRPGFVGMGGNTAQAVAAMGGMTTKQIAKHILGVAMGTVDAGKSGITGDEQSDQDQKPAQSITEATAQASVPTINFI